MKKLHEISFVGVCLILAALLVANVITPIASGIVFAIALVCYGLSKKRF